MITTPTQKKKHSKIIAARPHEDVKGRNRKNVHEFCDETVVNFINNFFFISFFCFVSFIVNLTFFTLESRGKLATKCSAVFLITLILKLLILGAFLGPYHRHILSLSNESMASIAYPKSYKFGRISYTTHLLHRQKNGCNLTSNLFNTHIVFNSLIFVAGRKDCDQKVGDGTNNFTEDPAYFLLISSIAILFALKQLRKSHTRFLSLF